MSNRAELMERLAYRAAWRKWFHKWQSVIFILVILAILVPSFLVFTPWFPLYLKSQIEKSAFDPVTQELRPWAVKRMYQLGTFLKVTMREKDGIACFEKIEEWYLGYSLEKWLRETLTQDDIHEPVSFDHSMEAQKYASYAIFDHAEYLRLKHHTQWAQEIYLIYITNFEGQPYADDQRLQFAYQHARPIM